MKECLICKQSLELSAFNKDPTRKDGHHPWCRECNREYKKNYYLKYKDKLLEQTKVNRLENLEKIREYDRQRSKDPKRKLRGRDTWVGRAKGMIASMRQTSKVRGWEWNESWWNAKDLVLRIENGKCSKTGVPFELLNNIGEHFKTNPCTPSIDRKDNLLGYHPNNTQIVCWFYNNLKRDHKQEVIDELIEMMLMYKLIEDVKLEHNKGGNNE